MNRIDSILDDEDVRTEYGLGAASPKSLYRTIERLGRNADLVVSHLGRQLTQRYGVTIGRVLMDWTSMYFEDPANGTVVRFGHSRDHRPDRPQVVIGLSVDQESGKPVGLTVIPGNILDVTHFEETFRQLLPLLQEDAMIVFNNEAYSRTNAKLIDDANMGFLTRLRLNASDDSFVRAHQDEWEHVCNDMYVLRAKGNLGRTRFIFLQREQALECPVRVPQEGRARLRRHGQPEERAGQREEAPQEIPHLQRLRGHVPPLPLPAGICQQGSGCGPCREDDDMRSREDFRAPDKSPVDSRTDPVDIQVKERDRDRVPRPEARDRLETGQMHILGCHQGTCADLVPGPVRHVHGQVPIPEAEVHDGGNDGLGTKLVLTYGPHTGTARRGAFQQLRAGHPRVIRSETTCSGAFGISAGGSGPVRITRNS